jgi:hypothetical protein
MAGAFVKISSVTVGAGGSSTMNFTSIPSTYTDLCVKLSMRTNKGSGTSDSIFLRMNGDTGSTNYKYRYLYGTGSSTATGAATTDQWCYIGDSNITSSTSNNFTSADVYIPNYLSNGYKTVGSDLCMENNTTTTYTYLAANAWLSTSAITSLSFITTASFVQYSTATLYGISKS